MEIFLIVLLLSLPLILIFWQIRDWRAVKRRKLDAEEIILALEEKKKEVETKDWHLIDTVIKNYREKSEKRPFSLLRKMTIGAEEDAAYRELEKCHRIYVEKQS